MFSCKQGDYQCGGYGNRLGGITSLLFLSILTKRAFLIEWDHGVPLEYYLAPKGIQWNYSMESLKHLDTRIHYLGKKEQFKKKRNDVFIPWKIKTDFVAWLRRADLSSYLNHPVEKMVSNWYFADRLLDNTFLGKFADELGISSSYNHSLIGCAFDFLFRKSQELKTRLDAARHSLGLASQVPSMGLHIRMGDVSFARGSLQYNNINYRAFFHCAQDLTETLTRQRRVSKTDIKWFLATDDKDVKQYALQNYGLNVVTLNITPHHIKSLKMKDSKSMEGTFNVMLDHFLLSECDFLILYNFSTFGHTAAGLNFHSKRTIIYGDSCVKLTEL